MAKKPKALFGGKAGVNVVVDPLAVEEFVNNNPEFHSLLMDTAKKIQAEATATASAAEKGPGGTLDGYADAGFSIEYEKRGGKRPRVNIKSNADGRLAFKVHMATQMRNGVGHLRAALYKFTTRG